MLPGHLISKTVAKIQTRRMHAFAPPMVGFRDPSRGGWRYGHDLKAKTIDQLRHFGDTVPRRHDQRFGDGARRDQKVRFGRQPRYRIGTTSRGRSPSARTCRPRSPRRSSRQPIIPVKEILAHRRGRTGVACSAPAVRRASSKLAPSAEVGHSPIGTRRTGGLTVPGQNDLIPGFGTPYQFGQLGLRRRSRKPAFQHPGFI